MSNFKLEFTLKQHTPIIHFQANQSGATLRATELKPKLDKFLIEQFKKEGVDYKNFLISGQEKALDYKIKIINKSNNEYSTPKAYVNPRKETDRTAYQAPYFAGEHKFILAQSDIVVKFFSFNTKLIKIIKNQFDKFLLYENFGTRQNKGFGSFARKDIKDNEIKNIFLEFNNPVFILDSYKDYQDAFKKIDIFYKKIKSGLNKPYHKSELFQYMCNKYKFGWEKKKIKNEFPSVIHGEHSPIVCQTPDDREFRYIRALLGLAEHNEYGPPEGKRQIKITNISEDEDKKIDRFKSPITFKPINNTIYLLFNYSYKDILNKKFEFSLGRDSFTINTPSKFDLYDFLKYLENKKLLKEEVKK